MPVNRSEPVDTSVSAWVACCSNLLRSGSIGAILMPGLSLMCPAEYLLKKNVWIDTCYGGRCGGIGFDVRDNIN